MKQVELPALTPRDRKLVRSQFDIGHMLRPRALIGWFLLVGGLMAVPLGCAALFGKGEQPMGLLISFGVQGVLGALMVRSVRKKRRERLRALTHGALSQGRVLRHSFALGLGALIKRMDTVIHVEVPLVGGSSLITKFASPAPGLRQQFPIGSQLQALVDAERRAVLIPAEYGAHVELDWKSSGT